MTAQSRPAWETAFLAALLVAVPVGLLLLIRAGIGAIARAFWHQAVRRATLCLAGAGIGAYFLAGMAGFGWAERVFALPVSPVYTQQIRFVADALTGGRDRASLSRPVPALDLQALDGGDVFVFFLESYGEVAYGVPEIAKTVRPRAVLAEQRLRDAGWHIASGYFTSPTFGGASWLAHASFLTGVTVSDNRDYQLLLSSAQPSLVGRFREAGYRTVALMPGLKLAWPEGRFYGFDRIYDAAALRYDGPSFGWWTIPDQFSAARLIESEVAPAGRKPLFVVFPTIMSHMPFVPVPPYLPDWTRAADPTAYGVATARGREAVGDWKAARSAYGAAMVYNVDMVEGFISKHAPPGALMLVLGDHQPPGIVSGPGADWRVPVHILTRDERRIAEFMRAGLRAGFIPDGATLGDFEALHRTFAAGLSRHP